MVGIKEYIDKGMTFSEYTALLDRLLTEGKTTGPNQSDAWFGYGKINRQRMKRLEKTIELSPETGEAISRLEVDWIWLVITEGWCGDAAQNIPIIEKIAALNEGIRTLYVLRDENPGLMDQYLTGGARSIPKLIAVDAKTLDVLGHWGARPGPAQQKFQEMRAGGIAKPLINEEMQRWYNADRGRSLQEEFVDLTAMWAANAQLAAVIAK